MQCKISNDSRDGQYKKKNIVPNPNPCEKIGCHTFCVIFQIPIILHKESQGINDSYKGIDDDQGYCGKGQDFYIIK